MSRWQVLAIEDVLGQGQPLREFFRAPFQARVHIRRTIAEALHFLHQSNGPALNPRPDAILIDVAAGGRAALDLVRHIKAHPAWRAIPVVALADALDDTERGEFLGAGVMHYWRKPSGGDENAELLQKLLRLLATPLAAPVPPTVRPPSTRFRRRVPWSRASDETNATSVIRHR